MTGICSAHKEFVAGCTQCETIGVEKPAMECHKCTATNCVEGCVNWQVYASYLEVKLKEVEEALNTTGFHGTQSHHILSHFNDKALKGLGKGKA